MAVFALAWVILSSPTVSITHGPPPATNNPRPKFVVATPDGTALECAVDDGTFRECRSPISLEAPLNDGRHVFRVRVPGNESSSAERVFLVDTVKPRVRLISPADETSTRAERIDIALDSDEPVVVTASNFAEIGTSLPKGQSSLTGIHLRVDGYNSFTGFFRDEAGNSTLLTFSLFRDNTPPRLSLLSPEDAGTVSAGSVWALFSLSEDVQVMESSPGFLPLGKKPGGEFSLELTLKEGSNEFSAAFRDAAGNESGRKSFRILRDSSKPGPPVVVHPSKGSPVAARWVTLAGTAPRSALSVRIDGSVRVIAAVHGGRFSTEVPLLPGPNVLRIASVNKGGTESEEIAWPVRCDAALRVSLIRGDLQIVSPGSVAPAPLIVLVSDERGAAVAGAPVTFDILGGNGAVGSPLAMTARDGLASTTVTAPDIENGRPLLIEATISNQVGPGVRFRVLAVSDARKEPGDGIPRHIVALGSDCASTENAAGDCPVAPAGATRANAFAVMVMDGGFRAVSGWDVTFRASAGTFGTSATVTAKTDAQGIARSGPFQFASRIEDPVFLLLHPADAFATGTRLHLVHATTAPAASHTARRLEAVLAAYAYPGPPARLIDAKEAASPGYVELASQEPLTVRVIDSAGNFVSNAAVTFTTVDSAEGPRLFRANVAHSTATPCTYRLAHRSDACAATTLSSRSGPDGIAWAQLLLGSRPDADYEAFASVEGAPRLTLVRHTEALDRARETRLLQIGANAASTFAIIGTENNDEDHVSAVTWQIRCDDGGCRAQRRTGDTVLFDCDVCRFRPSRAVTGSPAAFTGISAPEVGAVLIGGDGPGAINPKIDAEWGDRKKEPAP